MRHTWQSHHANAQDVGNVSVYNCEQSPEDVFQPEKRMAVQLRLRAGDWTGWAGSASSSR